MKKIPRTKKLLETIERLYYVEEKSTVDISKMLNMHTDIIREILKENPKGIRTMKEAGQIRSKYKKGFNISSDTIQKMKEGYKEQLQKGEFREMLSKHKQGEKNQKAKLNEKDVISIREEFNSYMNKGWGRRQTYLVMAGKYGVSQSTISSVIRRKTWSHI